MELKAGHEAFSSTKTYINTLISLYNGHGIDPSLAVDQIVNKNHLPQWIKVNHLSLCFFELSLYQSEKLKV